jgi:hypothetical protein
MLLQHVQTFSPCAKHLVLLCLGANIALSVLSDPNSKTNGKAKKECLRVTMVHGDIVVLSGDQFKASDICIYRRIGMTHSDILWQFSMVRTGMCMCKWLYFHDIVSR